jgi:hypothetical protein
MDTSPPRRIIVGSVASGPYTNFGNRLIERATFALLALPSDTPVFSVFEPISDELLDHINRFDYVIITGGTTLQDDPGHQACFDRQFGRIRARRICLGGGFYCDPDSNPSLRIARMYDAPIGARDPWSADFLRRNGIECEFVGCPTLLEGPVARSWREAAAGPVLVSSSPALQVDLAPLAPPERIRYLRHDPWSRGDELGDARIFDEASLVITGRLHAALPAVARGVRVRFYGEPHWHRDFQGHGWGSVRYTLLDYLGIDRDGNANAEYPDRQLTILRGNCARWLAQVLGPA